MNAQLEDDNYRIGFRLGKLYAEIQSYIHHAGSDGSDPLERTLLAVLEELGDIPEATTAVIAAIDAWEDD